MSDLNAVVGLIHRVLRRSGIEATFLRVPSKLNIADWPSRAKSPGVGTRSPPWTQWRSVARALAKCTRSHLGKEHALASCRSSLHIVLVVHSQQLTSWDVILIHRVFGSGI